MLLLYKDLIIIVERKKLLHIIGMVGYADGYVGD